MLERLEHGVYKGDSEEIDPSTLAQYCAGANGDGRSITDVIAAGQESQVHHPPVEAARSKSPFQPTLELEAFQQALQQATSKAYIQLTLGWTYPMDHRRCFLLGGQGRGSLFHYHMMCGTLAFFSGAGHSTWSHVLNFIHRGE